MMGVSGGVKLQIGSIGLLKFYFALSATMGGHDGMDGDGMLWMTISIYRTHQCDYFYL
jgi:hypothetical protein